MARIEVRARRRRLHSPQGRKEMQLSSTAIRWLALASIPGGVLLVLAWAIPAISLLPNIFAPDVRTVAGPTADLALLSTWFTLGFALLFAVVVLAIAKAARVSWVGATGAVLLQRERSS